jgi:hypothetical protein
MFAHLTFANTCWRSVQTFLVLLHTEAGGTPAFQSFAASRQMLSAVPTLGVSVLPVRFGDPVVGLRRRNRLAVGYPPYVAKTCWCSAQTFLVLLRTEAGGTPAFQSVPLRGNCRLRRRVTVCYINTIPAPSGRGQASPLQLRLYVEARLALAQWGGTRIGKTKTPNVGNADNRREAATDWNAGGTPASVH